MATEDLGTQKITHSYKEDATGQQFASYGNRTIKEGIYSGGELSVSGEVVTLEPFVAFFRTSGGEGVRVETSENITSNTGAVTPNIPLTNINPYITANYTWSNTEDNYLDFEAKAKNDIYDNDVIFGKAVYSGSVIASFDYTDKSWGAYDTDKNNHSNAVAIFTENSVSSDLLPSGLVLTSDIQDGGIKGYLNGQAIKINYEVI